MDLEAPLILAVIASGVYGIIKLVTEHRQRQRLIEKGLVDASIKNLFSSESELSILANLKWGMVLVGIGAAFFIYQFMDRRWDGEAALGLMFIFAGAGFLIYYPIAQRRHKEIERRNQQKDSSQ